MTASVSRLGGLLRHELSPAPLLGVSLGYWLPLEWGPRWSLLNGQDGLAKAYILGASAICNFVPAAVAAALGCYLAGLICAGFGASFRRGVHRGVQLGTWLVFMVASAPVLKSLALGNAPLPAGLKTVVAAVLALLAAGVLGLTLADRLDPARVLAPTLWLGLFAAPAALILVGCEALGIGHPEPLRAMAAAPRPDILLITVDALSARHLTPYGASRPTSPRLQALASQALTLDHFYANANWTRPGIASLLNGARPWTHDGDLGRPRAGVVTTRNLVRQLALGGYDTRCVATNDFAAPEAQGLAGLFQRVERVDPLPAAPRFRVRRMPSLEWAFLAGPARIWVAAGLRLHPRILEKTLAPVRAAEALLGEPADRPRFTWLHLVTVHDPYAAPAPFLGSLEPSALARDTLGTRAPYGFRAGIDPCFPRIYEGRYEEAIRCLDAGLGDLFDWLKAQGRFERTLVVVTADHGESFSHGYGGHGGPLLSEDLIWIPCLIKPPFHHGAVRVPGCYEQRDLAPTLLHLVGLPIPAGMDGRVIEPGSGDAPVFAMNRDLQDPRAPSLSVAVVQAGWKYVEHFGRWQVPWPRRELYDLAADPGELSNVAASRPDHAGPLRGLIVAELARHQLQPGVE